MEDFHFLIDYVPPLELCHCLISLSTGLKLSTKELISYIKENFGYESQKNFSNTTLRLYDLGLINHNNKSYSITSMGQKIVEIYNYDQEIYFDVIHYLHTTTYFGSKNPRKFFWSYRFCCDYLWKTKIIKSNSDLTKVLLSEIQNKWPEYYEAKIGGNFNEGGVSAWKNWIKELVPSPLSEKNRLTPRNNCSRYKIILLAIDDLYRRRGMRYGDPIIVNKDTLDEIAAVFFLDTECALRLINLTAKLSSLLSLGDTFAGMSITLNEAYGIERI